MTDEQKRNELNRLRDLYYDRKKEFDAAEVKRYVLIWLGFAVAFFVVFYCFGKPTGIDIFWAVCASLVLSLFHCWLNNGIYSWLYDKNYEENHRLAAIRQQFEEVKNEEVQ